MWEVRYRMFDEFLPAPRDGYVVVDVSTGEVADDSHTEWVAVAQERADELNAEDAAASDTMRP